MGLPVLPNDAPWVDIHGAIDITGLAANAINSHLAKAGPKRNPIPQPTRVVGRLFWPRDELVAWAAREP